jgi:hypothetical protein
MITNRLITDEDYSLLSSSLLLDEYHQGTFASFFYEEGTRCLVYEDEDGPICWVRGLPIVHNQVGMIQLDIQFLDNRDAKRNLKAMLIGFPELERLAKLNKFAGFFFTSVQLSLCKFCIKRLGFQQYTDELLVKVFQENECVSTQN